MLQSSAQHLPFSQLVSAGLSWYIMLLAIFFLVPLSRLSSVVLMFAILRWHLSLSSWQIFTHALKISNRRPPLILTDWKFQVFLVLVECWHLCTCLSGQRRLIFFSSMDLKWIPWSWELNAVNLYIWKIITCT